MMLIVNVGYGYWVGLGMVSVFSVVWVSVFNVLLVKIVVNL